MYRITNALRRMMYGRNGPDQLGMAVFVLSLVFLILARFQGHPVFAVLYYLCFILFVFRMFSRNIWKRQRENTWYLTRARRGQAAVTLRIRMLREIRTHRYVRCPGCRQMLRVPRGRGKINISCSRCKVSFIRKV